MRNPSRVGEIELISSIQRDTVVRCNEKVKHAGPSRHRILSPCFLFLFPPNHSTNYARYEIMGNWPFTFLRVLQQRSPRTWKIFVLLGDLRTGCGNRFKRSFRGGPEIPKEKSNTGYRIVSSFNWKINLGSFIFSLVYTLERSMHSTRIIIAARRWTSVHYRGFKPRCTVHGYAVFTVPRVYSKYATATSVPCHLFARQDIIREHHERSVR